MKAVEKNEQKNRQVLFFLGVFFVSLTSIAFEISLTRIFSVKSGYHFTYLVISVAMLGYGAAGTFLRLFKIVERYGESNVLSLSSFLFAVTIFLSYLGLNLIRFDPAMIGWERIQLFYAILIFLVLFVPFFFSGLTLSCAMYAMSRSVGKVYSSDLSGAGLGCFVPLLLFSVFRGEQVIMAIAVSGLLASLFFSIRYISVTRYLIPAAAVFFVYLLLFTPQDIAVNISQSRDLMVALRHSEAQILQTKWDAFSRIDILKSPAVRYAPGLSLKYTDPLPEQLGITVDSGDLHAITEIEESRMDFLKRLTSSVVYEISSAEDIFILEHAGGLDILTSLLYGAKVVNASETNKAVSGFVKSFYDSYDQEMFDFHLVNYIAEDARSYLKNDQKKYDAMIISMTNAFGASSGVFSSGENHRMTAEAFTEYFDRLNSNGFISITGYLKPVITEEGRIISTIAAALPRSQVAAIRSYATITTLAKKGTISKQEIAKLLEFCEENSFDLVYYPGMKREEANKYNRFPEPIYFDLYDKILDDQLRDQFVENYLFDIRPSTDDSPFFHNYFSINRLKRILDTMPYKFNALIQGGFLIPLVTLISFMLSTLLILLPVVFKNKKAKGDKQNESYFFAVLYFIFIGAAYMLIEIPFIHRMIPVLGNPTYAITVVLFSMLFSSGAGSLVQQKWIRNIQKGMVISLTGIIVILVIYSSLLTQFIAIIFSFSFLARLFLIMAALFPIGFLMGMPFPLLMRHAGEHDKTLIPWLWSANGFSSVVFASFSTALASHTGYSYVIMFAGAAYLLALISGVIYLRASPVIGTKATLIR